MFTPNEPVEHQLPSNIRWLIYVAYYIYINYYILKSNNARCLKQNAEHDHHQCNWSQRVTIHFDFIKMDSCQSAQSHRCYHAHTQTDACLFTFLSPRILLEKIQPKNFKEFCPDPLLRSSSVLDFLWLHGHTPRTDGPDLDWFCCYTGLWQEINLFVCCDAISSC